MVLTQALNVGYHAPPVYYLFLKSFLDKGVSGGWGLMVLVKTAKEKKNAAGSLQNNPIVHVSNKSFQIN